MAGKDQVELWRHVVQPGLQRGVNFRVLDMMIVIQNQADPLWSIWRICHPDDFVCEVDNDPGKH